MSSGLRASPERRRAAAVIPSRLKIWFDGGCRPNPGPMMTMVAAAGRVWHRADPGHGDNNDAEWLALLHAVEVARELGVTDPVLLGDSALVVDQASGRVPPRAPRFAARLAEFREMSSAFASLRIRRIGRAQNLAGIALERFHGKL